MRIKKFVQFIKESESGLKYFKPNYFNLPYSIPEDRFEGGLLKGNDLRRTSIPREILQDPSEYESLEEFFSKNPIEKVEKKVISEINRVVKFISNNNLTGKTLNAKFIQEISLEEYIDEFLEGENIPLGYIEEQLPFQDVLSIRVDYDIYKNIPIFTFLYTGDLFYYYTIFTLDKNDVLGGGEDNTYITADEMIDYLFYESVWRAAFLDLSQMGIRAEDIGFSEEEFNRLIEISEDVNYPRPIVSNYFDDKFVDLLRSWIETGNPEA